MNFKKVFKLLIEINFSFNSFTEVNERLCRLQITFSYGLSFKMLSNYLRNVFKLRDVNVLVNFETYLNRNYILLHKTSDDYVNNKSIDRKRAFIAYTQNINIWLFAIKFQILALFRDQWLDLLLGNPALPLSRPEIVVQAVAIICYLIGYFGNIS